MYTLEKKYVSNIKNAVLNRIGFNFNKISYQKVVESVHEIARGKFN